MEMKLEICSHLLQDAALNVNVNWIKVDGGRLAVGSATCALNSKITITLFGARSTANDIGPDLGVKGIAVLNGGTAEFFGAVSGPSWTRLGATAAAGATTIVLQEAVQWAVGSLIVITNTDFIGADYVPEQVENKTITAVSADRKTITLSSPLQFMHWGVAPESAEVGLLTRNIVIQGDASSVASQFGGHIIFYSQAASGKFRGVELTRMGQQGVLGRYPIHYHMMQDQTAQGHFVQDCSIHHNLQRCITIHNTNGVLIKDNVAFDTLGHCMFIEDGAEMQNTFDHNLAALARPVPTNPVIPSDNRPACFWITNPQNTYINNAASSCEFGFWFAFPMHPNGKSLNLYSTSLTLWPRFMPILRFDANVAHSHLDSGFFVDQMPDVNGVVAQQEYNPRQGPFVAGDEAPWKYPSVTVYFTNCIAYVVKTKCTFLSQSYSMPFDY
jgi:cell migration-inducing and hyaluronan-binding protein